MAEAKAHLRVDTDAEDALISGWIQSAREEAERMSGQALVTQTWRMKMDAFPDCPEIEIPLVPLTSVSSVKYVDTDGELQTWNSSNYVVDTSGVRGRIYRDYDVTSWPSTRCEPNAVRVEFVVGTDADDVKAAFKSWMLMNIGSRHTALREGLIVGTIASKNPDVDGLILGERVGL